MEIISTISNPPESQNCNKNYKIRSHKNIYKVFYKHISLLPKIELKDSVKWLHQTIHFMMARIISDRVTAASPKSDVFVKWKTKRMIENEKSTYQWL